MGGCSGYCGGERWSHLPGRGLRACIHNRWAGLFPAIRHPSMMNTGSKFFSLAIRCPGAHERRKKFFWKLVKKGFTNEKIWCIVILASGLVAQLGERSVRIREVESSNLFRSTSFEIPAAVLFPVFPEAVRWREFPRFRPLFFLVMFDGTGFPYGLSWQNAGKIAAFYQGPPVSHQNLAENGPL